MTREWRGNRRPPVFRASAGSTWAAKVGRCLTLALIASSLVFAQSDVKRPRVLGIAHVALYVSDLGQARDFYSGVLGFAAPFSLKLQDGREWISFVKVNDEQSIELFAGSPHASGRIAHIALYTDDVARMRDYLLSRGLKTVSELRKGQTGDSFFSVRDPEGHLLEIVQYQQDSWTARSRGDFMPAGRISNRIMHVGLQVRSADTAFKFYGDILGFRVARRESPDGKQVSGLDMPVPDGADYLEFTMEQAGASASKPKAQDHICFASSDVSQAAAGLQARGNSAGRSIAVQVDANSRQRATLVDPDGAHIELMEPPAGSSKSVPSSSVPVAH
jgi:catechol 2,3-dioxygenase-like lactoylglutathione lyase family enzyme